jgi:hypothetical protein
MRDDPRLPGAHSRIEDEQCLRMAWPLASEFRSAEDYQPSDNQVEWPGTEPISCLDPSQLADRRRRTPISRTCLLLLTLVVLWPIACDRSDGRSPAAVIAASKDAMASMPTEDQQEAQHDEYVILKMTDKLRENRSKAEQDFRLLKKSDRDAIEEVRSVIRQRPVVELTVEQREIFNQRYEHFDARDSFSFLFETATKDGAREIIRRLGLSPDDKVKFKVVYGNGRQELRADARRVILKALDKGIGSLSNPEKAILATYRDFLRNVKD